jgi:hypothetical protein
MELSELTDSEVYGGQQQLHGRKKIGGTLHPGAAQKRKARSMPTDSCNFEGHEERMALLAERASKGLPLFEGVKRG